MPVSHWEIWAWLTPISSASRAWLRFFSLRALASYVAKSEGKGAFIGGGNIARAGT